MPSRDILPNTDAGLATWMVLFASKIDAHLSALAISPADVATLKADALMVDWLHRILPAIRATAAQFTAYKAAILEGHPGGSPQAVPPGPTLPPPPPAVPEGVAPRTRALVQRIKKSPGYTEAIGRDLGIIAPTTTADAAPKPTFQGTALPHSEVRLDWTKKNHSGVTIQGKRAGDAAWIDLGKDNYSPYVDGRAPVTAGTNETREYRMRYLDKDDEVGEWSDMVSVVTTA